MIENTLLDRFIGFFTVFAQSDLFELYLCNSRAVWWQMGYIWRGLCLHGYIVDFCFGSWMKVLSSVLPRAAIAFCVFFFFFLLPVSFPASQLPVCPLCLATCSCYIALFVFKSWFSIESSCFILCSVLFCLLCFVLYCLFHFCTVQFSSTCKILFSYCASCLSVHLLHYSTWHVEKDPLPL